MKVWAPKGVRPVCTVTGSHQRTVIFGAMSLDGRQIFRQYDSFTGEDFLHFLKKVYRKFGKFYLFLDKARQHYRTKKVLKYISKNRATLRARWIPTGCPEFNVMEEVWRQTDKDRLASRYYPSFTNLRRNVAEYLRTKRFNLDMKKFLLTNRAC